MKLSSLRLFIWVYLRAWNSLWSLNYLWSRSATPFTSHAIEKGSSFSVGANEGNTHTHTCIHTHTEREDEGERVSSPGYESWFMTILFPFPPFPGIGLGMGFWPISGWWDRKEWLLGLSIKIFLTARVWYRKRKALFALSPSFLLVTLPREIISLSPRPSSCTHKGRCCQPVEGGRMERQTGSLIGLQWTVEPTLESLPFRLLLRVDHLMFFYLSHCWSGSLSATCNQTHIILRTTEFIPPKLPQALTSLSFLKNIFY